MRTIHRKNIEYMPKCMCNIAATTAGLIGAGIGAAGQFGSAVYQGNMNKKTREFNQQEAEKQRAWNEKMWQETNAWNLEMWNKTNEYNTPKNQVQMLRDAGLNPLYYGLDGMSANGVEAGQPLGYERAEADNQPNPLSQIDGSALANAIIQGKLADKEMELKNAQIDKLKEDTKGVELDNEWKDRTMDARADAEELANAATREQIEVVKQQKKNMEQELKKLAAETETEQERKLYVIAETALARANEKEILSLLPYRILLTEAQTEAERADAAMKWTQQAYQQGLIDNGYLDALCDDMKHQATISGVKIEAAEADKELAEFRAAVRGGTAMSYEGKSWFGRGMSVLGNTFLRTTSQLSEAMGGSIVPLVGGYMLGNKGKGATPPSPNAPQHNGSSTVLYDADGRPAVTSTWKTNY